MDTKSMWDCYSHRISNRQRKYRYMRPRDDAGNTVGTKRNGSRTGGKRRGMKAGRQRQAKVNVAKLVQKTNKSR